MSNADWFTGIRRGNNFLHFWLVYHPPSVPSLRWVLSTDIGRHWLHIRVTGTGELNLPYPASLSHLNSVVQNKTRGGFSFHCHTRKRKGMKRSIHRVPQPITRSNSPARRPPGYLTTFLGGSRNRDTMQTACELMGEVTAEYRIQFLCSPDVHMTRSTFPQAD